LQYLRIQCRTKTVLNGTRPYKEHEPVIAREQCVDGIMVDYNAGNRDAMANIERIERALRDQSNPHAH
jgi:hypothetical protein